MRTFIRRCSVTCTDAKRARWMALFVEEMAGNIVQHGKPRKSMSASADLRLYVD